MHGDGVSKREKKEKKDTFKNRNKYIQNKNMNKLDISKKVNHSKDGKHLLTTILYIYNQFYILYTTILYFIYIYIYPAVRSG